jgi:DNA-binding NarL/FixJ family response regulator
MKNIRVLIADDQALITESFKVLLESRAEDITVVGTARNGKEAAATPADRDRQEVLRELSRREIAILRLLAQGEGNKEIGLKMNAAEQTIKNVVSTIYTKLGVDNRREARRFALETGLINLTDLLR